MKKGKSGFWRTLVGVKPAPAEANRRTAVDSVQSSRLIGALIPDPQVFSRVQAVAQLANVQVVSLLDLSTQSNLDVDVFEADSLSDQFKPLKPPHSALEVLRRCELLVIAVEVPLSEHLVTLCQAPRVLVGPGPGADIQLPGDEVVLARLLQTQTRASPDFRGLVLVGRWNSADSWNFAHRLAEISQAILLDCAPEFPEWLAPTDSLTWSDLTPGDLPDGRTVLQTLPKAGSVPCLTNASTQTIDPADTRVADLALRLPKHQVIHCGQVGEAAINLYQEFLERTNLEFPILLLGQANSQKITSFARTMYAIKENCGITPTPIVIGAVSREFKSLCVSEKIRFFQLKTLSKQKHSRKQIQAIRQHIKT